MLMRRLLLIFTFALLSTLAMAQVTITNLGVTAQTSTSATIQWDTSAGATTQLFYGLSPTPLPSNTTKDLTLVGSHTASITGITNNEIVYYAAESVDNVGHITRSPVQSFELCSQNGGATPGYTQVSGTVNNYYEYGNYSIAWTNQSGRSIAPTVCGQPIQSTYLGPLDQSGTLNVSL